MGVVCEAIRGCYSVVVAVVWAEPARCGHFANLIGGCCHVGRGTKNRKKSCVDLCDEKRGDQTVAYICNSNILTLLLFDGRISFFNFTLYSLCDLSGPCVVVYGKYHSTYKERPGLSSNACSWEYRK